MNAPNAKAIIEKHSRMPLSTLQLPKLLVQFGRELVHAESAYYYEWNRDRCAVCGDPVKPRDLHNNQFNIVCGDHQEFGVYFNLRAELDKRGMPLPPRCPDFWEGSEIPAGT